jgi:hypothetical protein
MQSLVRDETVRSALELLEAAAGPTNPSFFVPLVPSTATPMLQRTARWKVTSGDFYDRHSQM